MAKPQTILTIRQNAFLPYFQSLLDTPRLIQHGDQAALRAAVRADALLDAGDLDSAATWRKIIAAIEAMRSTEPEGRLH